MDVAPQPRTSSITVPSADVAWPIAALPGRGTRAGLPGESGRSSRRKAWVVEYDLGHPAIRRLV